MRPATDLVAAAEQLVAGGARQLDSAALRDALLDLYDFWLTTKATEIGITATSGFAIVATGGLGRGEMLPFSDLDLMLLHDNMPADVGQRGGRFAVVPVVGRQHSARPQRPDRAAGAQGRQARTSPPGWRCSRHATSPGTRDLSSLLIGGARRQWRTGIASRFDELVEHTRARWQRSGQIAHRAEPDLKCGRGGLRDVQLLNALAIAQLADVYPSRSLASPTETLGEAHLSLLNVRTELHRVAGRGRELLLAQHADEIGARCASATGSTWPGCSPTPRGPSATTSTQAFARRPTRYRAAVWPRCAGRYADRSTKASSSSNGEVILARDARPERDPGLILRVAAASATTGLPMAASTLSRLVGDRAGTRARPGRARPSRICS